MAALPAADTVGYHGRNDRLVDTCSIAICWINYNHLIDGDIYGYLLRTNNEMTPRRGDQLVARL